MATKRTRIIVNLPPNLGALVKTRADQEGRSDSNFVGRIIEEWAAGEKTSVVEEEQAAYHAGPTLKKRNGGAL